MRNGSLKLFAANMMHVAFYGALVFAVVALVSAIMVSLGFFVAAATVVGKVATWVVLASIPVFVVSLAVAFTE